MFDTKQQIRGRIKMMKMEHDAAIVSGTKTGKIAISKYENALPNIQLFNNGAFDDIMEFITYSVRVNRLDILAEELRKVTKTPEFAEELRSHRVASIPEMDTVLINSNTKRVRIVLEERLAEIHRVCSVERYDIRVALERLESTKVFDQGYAVSLSQLRATGAWRLAETINAIY